MFEENPSGTLSSFKNLQKASFCLGENAYEASGSSSLLPCKKQDAILA